MRLLAISIAAVVAVSISAVSAPRNAPPCAPDNAGLKLPPGFCATLFADSLGLSRHVDVAPNGDVIVGLRAQPARPNATPPVPASPGGVRILRDRDGDGRAEAKGRQFGDSSTTTVKLVGANLYVETGRAILRYRVPPGAMEPDGRPDTIVGGLPGDRSHAPKTFAIRDGHLYVNHGSPSNVCQEAQGQQGSTGKDPCPELADRAGIWRYDMTKTGQTIASGERFATGIRNAVAIAFEPRSGNLYVVQHGRDALNTNFPALYTAEKNAETPAEEMFLVNRGDDFGWPYCYFDPELKKKVLAPEYGGDGKAVGRCAEKKGNVAFFPGHWAPDGLLFYTGSALPAKYRNGAFIVFHGSWNRAPLPNQGFKVVFQPMANGRAQGDFEVFADGFYENGQPTALGGRPMGIAQGRDGEIYVSDDSRGRIFRISYHGSR